MTFREKMRVQHSAAETQMFVALQERNLTKGMLTDFEIPLLTTVPDFFWVEEKVACYLDGEQVHSGIKAEARDDRITEALEKRGVRVLRFRYRPPISRKRLNEIVEEIQGALKRAA